MTTTRDMFTVAELDAMPTLIQGQAEDCKVSTPTERVWLSRLTPADGFTGNRISFEHFDAASGKWRPGRARHR